MNNNGLYFFNTVNLNAIESEINIKKSRFDSIQLRYNENKEFIYNTYHNKKDYMNRMLELLTFETEDSLIMMNEVINSIFNSLLKAISILQMNIGNLNNVYFNSLVSFKKDIMISIQCLSELYNNILIENFEFINDDNIILFIHNLKISIIMIMEREDKKSLDSSIYNNICKEIMKLSSHILNMCHYILLKSKVN